MGIIPIFWLLIATAPAFEGQLTYFQSATGGERSKLVKVMAAEMVRVAMSDKGGYRQDEVSGAYPGSDLTCPKKAPDLEFNHRDST